MGQRKEFGADDLYKPLKEQRANIVGDKLCKAWEQEIKIKTSKNRKPSLLRATFRAFGIDFISLGLYLLVMEFSTR